MALILQLTLGATSIALAETRLLETATSLGPAPEQPALTTVSPDGRRVAAIVLEKSLKRSVLSSLSMWGLEPKTAPGRILVDGEFSQEYKLIAFPTFSPDGKRFAYLAMLPADQFPGPRPKGLDPKLGPFQVVVDGEAGPIWPVAAPPLANGQLVFSPDGEQIVFQALKGEDSTALVVNQVETEVFSGSIYSVVFSPDGKRRAMIADREDQRVVIVDGEERGRYDGATALTFSSDGQVLAYIARRGKRYSVVVNGTEYSGYEPASDPVFSPDGKHVAYWSKDRKAKVLMLDGSEIGRGDFLASSWTRATLKNSLGPVFSPDSQRLAYVLKDYKDATLVIGETKQSFQMALPFGLSFSSDAKRFAYGLFKDEENMLYAVVDGQELETGFHEASRVFLGSTFSPSRMIVPTLSPDGQHCAYLRTKKPKRWWKDGPNLQIVIDGVGSSYFESVVAMGWESPTTLWAVVKRADEYLRIELRLPGSPVNQAATE